ncbi:MAG: DUF6438 domain-containing protein [Stagnimonas sp.]|nr:DUF6438 domain-containing protein [Stagnimonas sp.]
MSSHRPSTGASLALLSLLLLAACAAAEQPAVPAESAAPAPAPQPSTPPASSARPESAVPAGDFELSLQRGPCYGRCPQYSLQLQADGSVRFEGERHVAAAGEQLGRADPARLAALIEQLRQPELARLKDIYRPGQSGCGQTATDMPSSLIEWTLDGRRHRIQYYQGCAGAPAALRRLPAQIDEAAGSRRWIEQGVDR